MFADLYIKAIPFLVILITTIGVYYIITKPIYALYIIIFTFPFKNFYIYIGTSFEIWKLLSLAFLLFKLPIWLFNTNSKFLGNKYFKVLNVFVLYVIVLTVVSNLFLVNEKLNLTGGFLKNEGRLISQLIFFGLTINLMIIPFFVIKTLKDLINCLKALFYSVILLSFFGILQFFIFHYSGFNPFPIQGSDGVNHTAYLSDTIFRINSLAGEPKHMAIAMVIGISIILLNRIHKIKITKYELPLLFIFIFNLFYTFSTTGYVLLGVSLFIIYLIKGIHNFRNIIIGSIGLLIVIWGISNTSKAEKIAFNNQLDRMNFEIQDESIKTYFTEENPLHFITGTGLGNIHYYTAKYIPSDFPLFKDTPYKANSGILYMLSDFGLIGILIIYSIFFQLLRRNKKKIKKHKLIPTRELIVLTDLSFVFGCLFLFRYYELFYLLMGIMIQLNVILTKGFFIRFIKGDQKVLPN
jgi:hypothetical protein